MNLSQIDVWFQDESRIGQQGSITRMWAKKGTRPRAVRQQQFEYAYIFGATCPQKDEAIGLILPTVNTLGMILKKAATAKQSTHCRADCL